MNNKLKDAVTIVCEELKKDPEYYYGWQSNIAMAFYDVFKGTSDVAIGYQELHRISNEAAKRFLDQLRNK